MAMIMLGAAKFGKSKLESYAAANPANWFYMAYADWCQGRTREALKCLAMAEANGGDPNADRLRELITARTITIVVFYNDDTESAVPTGNLPGVNVHAFRQGDFDQNARLTDLLPPSEPSPDIILICNIAGTYLPPDTFEIGVPVVLLSNDFDQRICGKIDDLSRADLVIVETAYEAYAIEKICGTRTVTSHGFCYSDPPRSPPRLTEEKSLDIGFSGKAFVRHWRDRARYLFRIATLDDPALRIRIHHGCTLIIPIIFR